MSETTGSFKFLTEKDPAWMSDNASTGCVGCGNEFGFFTRRHHCRICGKLFCDVCCNHQLSSQGTTARVCVVCWLEHSEEPKKKHEKALKAKKNVIFSTIGSENQYCMDIILDEFGLYISRQEDTTTTHIFLLDIVFLELQSFDRVTIKYSGGRYFGKNGSPETRTIITHNFKGLLDSTLSAFKLITLGATSLGIDLKGVEEPEIDPPPLVAGGYLHTYRAFCSLLNIRPNRDVEMYVEDSAQQDNRHFVLDNIPGALSRDQTYQGSLVRPVLASLYWNTYYTSLSILGDYKKVDEAVVAQLLGLNQTFTSFQFSGEIHAIGKSPPPAFCNSMIENKGLQITDLDLKGSTISSPFIFKALPNFKNLRRLCLRECHVSQKILEEMFQTFQENPEESSQIEDLDFSSVDFAVPFMASMNLAEKFSDWIVAISPNAKSGHISRLRNINLSKTNMDFSKVLWRFEKLPDLEYLDVSNNKLIGDAAPQLLSFAQSSTIEKLVMQQCEFVSQEKKNLCDVVVNFLRNKNLQPGAASCWVGKNTGLAFEQIPVESIRTETLFHLDLNGIGFSSNAFCKLLHFLEGFENLTILNLDNCLRARKKDHGDERKTPGEAISHFVNRAHSPLQCISLAGSYGGDILQPFMRDLSENVSLRELNISNNHLDDWGGMWIAKLLRTRCGLRFLAVDGNRLGLSSCQAIATSLEKNVTLLYLDFIWTDYQHKVTLYSANRQKKYRTSLSLIQHHLWRNRATSKEVYYPSLKLLMEGKPLSEEVKNKRRCAFGASEEKANPPASFSPQRQASMLSPRAKPKSPKRAPSPVAVVPTPTPTPKEVVSSSSSSSSSSSVSAAASSGSAENVMSIFDDLDEPMPPPLPVKLGEVFSIEGESDEEDAESKKKDLVAPVSAAATAAAAATSPPASRGRGALPTPGGAQKGGGRGMQRAMSVMSTSSAAAQQQKQSSTMSPNRASMTRQQSEVANLRKSAASRPQAPTPPKGGSAISSTSSTGLGPLPPTAAPPPPTSTSGGQKEKKEKTSLSSGPPPSAAPPPPSAAPPPPPPAAAPPPPPPVSASLPPMNKNRNAMLSSISDFKKGKLKKVKESDKRDFSSATASSKGGGGGGGSGGSGGGGSGTSRRPPAKPSPMDELQAKINARNKK